MTESEKDGTKPITAAMSDREQELLTQIQALQRELELTKTTQSSQDGGTPEHGGAAFNNGNEPKTIVVVTNRLPVSLSRDENGEWKFKMSSGGLVSALRGVKGIRMTWIGWPGMEIPEEDRADVTAQLAEMNCVPVFLGQSVAELYYNGFSNDVEEYQKLAREVHELVGRINGKFGHLHSLPIHFLDQSIAFERMVALYHIADVCLVTSLRDGMNLVSYEFIVSQMERHGVLILSEFAGAAQSLGAACLRINPWNIDACADQIRYALSMDASERRELHDFGVSYVKQHSAQHWADTFIASLVEAWRHTAQSTQPQPIIPPKLDIQRVRTAFQEAKNRVLLLGMIGTVTPDKLRGMTFDRFLRYAKCAGEVSDALRALSADPNTTVIILTARSRSLTEKLVGATGAWMCAENGYFVQLPDQDTDEWQCQIDTVDLSWMDEVERVLQYFVERTPKSFIEKQETFISWQYPDADPDFAETQSRDLVLHLGSGPLINTATEVINSHKTVQIRPKGINKASMAKRLLQRFTADNGAPDFVLCAGNFMQGDEELFSMLHRSADNKPMSPRQSPITTMAIDSSSHSTNASSSSSSSSGIGGGHSVEFGIPSGHHHHHHHHGDHSNSAHVGESLRVSLAQGAQVFTANVGCQVTLAQSYIQNAHGVEQLLRSFTATLTSRNGPSSIADQPQPPSTRNVVKPAEETVKHASGATKTVSVSSSKKTVTSPPSKRQKTQA